MKIEWISKRLSALLCSVVFFCFLPITLFSINVGVERCAVAQEATKSAAQETTEAQAEKAATAIVDQQAKKQVEMQEAVGQEQGKPLARLVKTIGALDQSHNGVIKNVRVLKDGRRLLTCAEDGITCLWDIQTRKILRRFYDGKATIAYCLDLTPDEKYLLTAGTGKKIVQWDLESGDEVAAWKVTGDIFAIAVTPDGKSFVAGDRSGNLDHYFFGEDKARDRYKKGTEDITALKMIPDGSGFVSGDGNGVVRVWLFGGEEPGHELEGLSNWTCCLAFSDSAKRLAGCDYSGGFVVWDFESLKNIWSRTSVSGELSWLRFVTDDQIVAVDGSDQMIKFDVPKKKTAKSKIDMPSIGGFDFSPDKSTLYCAGRNYWTASSAADGKLVSPSLEQAKSLGPIRALQLGQDRVYHAGDRGVLLASDRDSGKRLYDFSEAIAPSKKKKGAPSKKVDQIIGFPNKPEIVVLTETKISKLDSQGNLVRATSRAKNDKGSYQALPDGFILRRDLSSGNLTKLRVDDESVKQLKSSKTKEAVAAKLMDDRFAVEAYEKSLSIFSFPDMVPLKTHSIQDTDFDVLSVSKNLVVARTERNQLIGFLGRDLESQEIDDARFKVLFEQLDSKSFRERENATESLAGTGEAGLEKLKGLGTLSSELSYRIRLIEQRIKNRGVPDFDRPAKSSFDKDPEVFSASDYNGHWLAAFRDGPSSILKIGTLRDGKFETAFSRKLRARVTKLDCSKTNPREFAIGFADGTVEVWAFDE